MKPYTLVLLLLLVGCNSEVDILTDDFVSTPVIYGIIDPFDSIQSIRVQRSFLIRDKEGALLQDPDSLYFKAVRIWLDGMVGDSCHWSIELEKSNVQKEDGGFTGVGHHVFSHFGPLPITLSGESKLRPGVPDISQLKMRVQIADLSKEVFASETVYSPCKVLNDGGTWRSISLYGENVTKFSLVTASKTNSGHKPAEIRFEVFIREYTKTNRYFKTVSWHTSTGFGPQGYEMTPERFFNRIMMGLNDSDSIEVRALDSVAVEMTFTPGNFSSESRNQELYGVVDYPLSKIEGCYGFFTTKSKGRMSNLQLDSQSMDSLCNGMRWKHLKFVHW